MPKARVPLRCTKSGAPFTVIFRSEDQGVWQFVWANTSAPSQPDGTDRVEISGRWEAGPDYPGCPHCAAGGIARCNCGGLSCWDGSSSVICRWCGRMANVAPTSTFRAGTGGEQ